MKICFYVLFLVLLFNQYMPKFDDSLSNDRVAELRKKEEEHLIKTLASQYAYQYVNLQGITINPEALELVDEKTSREAELVPFELQYKKLTVALRNPNNKLATQTIQNLKDRGYSVSVVMTARNSLEHAWERYRDEKKTVAEKKGVLDINTDKIKVLRGRLGNIEKTVTYLKEIRTANTARRVSETLEAIFAGALGLGSSDIHIEPEETGIRLRYRIDGVLHDIINLERRIYEQLISRLKLLSGMKLNVHNEAQDGRFTFSLGEEDVEVRSSSIPGSSGETMVMRLLDPKVASFDMEKLGLSPKLHKILDTEISRPNGMIITTGPTGSGKTTALYAFLRKAHNESVKIITIEDPVEYKIDNIVQTQVTEEYTFESGLRAILRQDPDILMVGEIRDRTVAETALHAAQTGHLVFTTLHTNSAVGAFPRLIDLGVDDRVMGSAINIVIGQRLIRVLCETCKKKRTPTEQEKREIKKVVESHPYPPILEDNFMIYEPVGCGVCGDSGFKGRVGIFEAILVDDAVEEAILRDPREHIILEAAQPQGIPTMAEDGIEKVLKGQTSLAELKRVIDLSNIHDSDKAKKSENEDIFFKENIV